MRDKHRALPRMRFRLCKRAPVPNTAELRGATQQPPLDPGAKKKPLHIWNPPQSPPGPPSSLSVSLTLSPPLTPCLYIYLSLSLSLALALSLSLSLPLALSLSLFAQGLLLTTAF